MPAEPRQTNPRAPTERVFFALWPPPEVAGRLAALAASYAALAGGRPTRREAVHLTLAFIGEVPVERLPELERAARRIRAEFFRVTLDNFCVWRRNRIFRAACSVIPAALAELESSLKAALLEAGFAVADVQRPFVPHATLARKVAVPETALPPCEPVSWHCEKFVLVRSMLSPDGSSYQTIGEFPLGTCQG